MPRITLRGVKKRGGDSCTHILPSAQKFGLNEDPHVGLLNVVAAVDPELRGRDAGNDDLFARVVFRSTVPTEMSPMVAGRSFNLLALSVLLWILAPSCPSSLPVAVLNLSGWYISWYFVQLRGLSRHPQKRAYGRYIDPLPRE